MLRTVMVPLDGSAYSEHALAYAVALAHRHNSELRLATVRLSASPTRGSPEGAMLAQAADKIGPLLRGPVTCRVLRAARSSSAQAARRHIADVLARHAADNHADLIVMTTHGNGGVRRAWLGSVADVLMRIAPVPVMLIRPSGAPEIVLTPPATGIIEHILVPLDGSSAAEAALLHATAIGAPFAARYTLMRIISPADSGTDERALPDADPATWSVDRLLATGYLERVATPLREAGHTVATLVAEADGPAPALIRHSARHDVDLLVLTSAGVGGVGRFLMGSVADKLVRAGVVPVVVCHPVDLPRTKTDG